MWGVGALRAALAADSELWACWLVMPLAETENSTGAGLWDRGGFQLRTLRASDLLEGGLSPPTVRESGLRVHLCMHVRVCAQCQLPRLQRRGKGAALELGSV